MLQRNRKMIWHGAALFILTAASAQAEPSYLCLIEQSVGFRPNSQGTWQSTVFAPSNRYLIRPMSAAELGTYKVWMVGQPETVAVFKFGNTHPTALCHWYEDNLSQRGLTCSGLISARVNFNPQELRIQVTHMGAYVYPPPNGQRPDDPSIEIGRCSAL